MVDCVLLDSHVPFSLWKRKQKIMLEGQTRSGKLSFRKDDWKIVGFVWKSEWSSYYKLNTTKFAWFSRKVKSLHKAIRKRSHTKVYFFVFAVFGATTLHLRRYNFKGDGSLLGGGRLYFSFCQKLNLLGSNIYLGLKCSITENNFGTVVKKSVLFNFIKLNYHNIYYYSPSSMV